MVPQQMEMVVEEVTRGLCFHNGHTTSILSSSRGHTQTPMRMPTTTSVSTTSTRYPGTPIVSLPPVTISPTTIIIIIIARQIIIIIIDTNIFIIRLLLLLLQSITIITAINMSNSPEISVIETLLSVCKVILKSLPWKLLLLYISCYI